MIVFAHRGFSGKYPENTMLAFGKAVEAGCDGIELDVHETADGKLVIIHDESVDRTTDGHGRVCDFSYAQLKQLNAAKLFAHITPFEPVPSFEEYCRWAQSLDIITNIEIKTDNVYYPEIEQKVCDTIFRYGLEHKVILSSFNHISLLRVKEISGDFPVGALVERENFVKVYPGYYCARSGFEYYHPAVSMLSDEMVASCARHGIGINVWTVNTPEDVDRLWRWNCNGMITNFPDMAKARLAMLTAEA